jgi:hypothetical protein
MERILLRSVLVTLRINIRQRKFTKDESIINKFDQAADIGVIIFAIKKSYQTVWES